MKPKNKTKKKRQTGGEPFTLTPATETIFEKIYNTSQHSHSDEQIQQLNDKIFQLFEKSDESENITSISKFITI